MFIFVIMIDNFELIRPLLNFQKKGDFYMLYVFKRKKDQPQGERDNHQSVRTIKTYCIESMAHLESRLEEIKGLCEFFRARAYIHVQGQNHSDVSLNMMSQLAQKIQAGNYNQKGLFDSVVGQIKTQEKRWVVDIDTGDPHHIQEVTQFIQGLRPEGGMVLATIPTKAGVHLVTERFDTRGFSQKYPHIDIQKKNPTVLYIPSCLGQK